jgi:hypothetical protein
MKKKDYTTQLGSIENPVKCDGVTGELIYLDNLVTADGEPIQFKRVRSLSIANGKILDEYIIKHSSNKMNMTVYFDMYHPKYNENEIIEGLVDKKSFYEIKKFQNIEYFHKIKLVFFDNCPIDISSQYIYIWAKAGRILAKGPYIYALEDAFGFPKMKMNLIVLKQLAHQIVHRLEGIHEGHPLVIGNLFDLKELMETFHFKLINNKKVVQETTIQKIDCKHVVTGEIFRLYIKLIHSES